MNGKKSKRIRAHVCTLAIDWLKGLMNEEEAKKITIDNYKSMMPSQTHIISKGTFKLSAFTERWMAQKIKKILKQSPERTIESITFSELNV
jgi:hypothetical protein|tara:strand:+ start:393 stop:665 length:273 start_codon:yes stop_codon:yes gene_type:complete